MNSHQKLFFLGLFLVVLALGLIIWGVRRGENRETRTNAHYLCLECMGIGK